MSRYFLQEVYGKRFSGVDPITIFQHPKCKNITLKCLNVMDMYKI